MNYSLSLKDIKKDKTSLQMVGGKAYGLGIMLTKGFNVPPGFVLTSTAYSYYLSYNKIGDEVRSVLATINKENIFLKSQLIKEKIMSGEIPQILKAEVKQMLLLLKSDFLAIRSSAVGEDILDSSFAGLHDSYLGVRKKIDIVMNTIKRCWASIYNPTAIFYRLEKGFYLQGEMCVVIQEMIASEISGVVFSSFPSPDKCTIESTFGLGNLMVSGEIEPDVFVLRKNDQKIIKKTAGKKNRISTLTSREAIRISKQALSLEKLFGVPQDIEWAIYDKNLFILQSRPFKQIKEKKLRIDELYSPISTPVISGLAFKIKKREGKLPPKESILIIDESKPQYVPFLKNAKAVICERGGILNHFAIVCRELGIPFLVLEGATKIIKDKEWLEINVKQPTIKPMHKGNLRCVKIMNYIPSPPEVYIQNLHKKLTENLPHFINKNYPLDIQIKSDGIYIIRISLNKFIDDIMRNLGQLNRNLRRYAGMPDDKKFSIALLACIIVDELFDILVTLTKDINIALSLIRKKYAFYLELDEVDVPYLMHHGIANEKITIPNDLKNRLKTTPPYYESDTRKISKDAEENRKIKILSNILKALIKAYEEKNKLKINYGVTKVGSNSSEMRNKIFDKTNFIFGKAVEKRGKFRRE